MTAADVAEEAEATAERWTYAGNAEGRSRAVVEIWWDADGHRYAYAPGKGSNPIPGGLYEVKVRRSPDGREVTRYGGVTFVGPNPDRDVRARAEAEAENGRRDVARGQIARKMKRGGVLADAIAPVKAAAATMTGVQREAFIALISREVYRATKADR